MIKHLTRTVALGVALAAVAASSASAQVTVNAACDPVVSGCDRIAFDFTSLTPGEFFNVIIRTTDPNFTFRSDNTDPVGGGAFQNGEVFDIENSEDLVFPGAIDPFGTGQQFSLFPFSLPTQLTGSFILSLYFNNAGVLAPGTFSFEAEYRDAAGAEFDASGTVGGVTVGVVPEPGTVLLLASGLAGIGAVTIRRRRAGTRS